MTDNQPTAIPDLEAVNADAIKGGPTPKSRRNVLLQSSATDQGNGLADLEPDNAGQIKGGPKPKKGRPTVILKGGYEEEE